MTETITAQYRVIDEHDNPSNNPLDNLETIGDSDMAANYSESRRTELKKELFEKLKEVGYISDACRLIGIDRRSYYRWLESDPAFAAEIEAREAEAKEARRVRLVREVERRALAGSDILLMFATKAHDESYRDKQQIDITATSRTELSPASVDDLRAEFLRLASEAQKRGLLVAKSEDTP